jgi:signal transduction histidine kinase
LIVDALWLATLQAVCGRAAHEVRGSLNAVAVNLEVVRSRSERPDAPASAVAPYTTIAASQLEDVIAMTEAMMALVRPGRGVVDIATEISRIVTLMAPAARSAGRAIELDRDLGGLGTTSASSSSVRLAIGHCLLAVPDASTRARTVQGAARQLRLEHDGPAVAIDSAVRKALSAAGIVVHVEASAVVITFPQ